MLHKLQSASSVFVMPYKLWKLQLLQIEWCTKSRSTNGASEMILFCFTGKPKLSINWKNCLKDARTPSLRKKDEHPTAFIYNFSFPWPHLLPLKVILKTLRSTKEPKLFVIFRWLKFMHPIYFSYCLNANWRCAINSFSKTIFIGLYKLYLYAGMDLLDWMSNPCQN